MLMGGCLSFSIVANGYDGSGQQMVRYLANDSVHASCGNRLQSR